MKEIQKLQTTDEANEELHTDHIDEPYQESDDGSDVDSIEEEPEFYSGDSIYDTETGDTTETEDEEPANSER